jgi:hypothetical protein
MGAIIMRWLSVVLPFAMVRGVKTAEEPPRGAGVNEPMDAGGKDNNYTNIRIRE